VRDEPATGAQDVGGQVRAELPTRLVNYQSYSDLLTHQTAWKTNPIRATSLEGAAVSGMRAAAEVRNLL
jgi:hypothetical protein